MISSSANHWQLPGTSIQLTPTYAEGRFRSLSFLEWTTSNTLSALLEESGVVKEEEEEDEEEDEDEDEDDPTWFSVETFLANVSVKVGK